MLIKSVVLFCLPAKLKDRQMQTSVRVKNRIAAAVDCDVGGAVVNTA